ncbi:MAG: protein kinase [Prosthecobacter sp.]
MSHEPEIPADPTEVTSSASAFPTLEEMSALLPQYEFHNILGIGGMGAVYLARQTALDRWEAIKLLPASASLNDEDAGRFITEARSMAKLIHPHIAAVHDFGQTSQGQLYLVMEYVNGLDLHRVIQGGELTQEHIRSLVGQLCDALQYAHEHGVIHRDIKPANILIAENCQVKIVDFGLASDKNSNLQTGSEYGTPDYVAPERLITGAGVDHRSDIYSLGVVIHEMFTGLTPQAAGTAAGHGMPAEYVSIVNRCLMADPAQRFQQCREIKQFLTAATSIQRNVPAPAPTAAPTQRPLPPHLQARVSRSPVPQPRAMESSGKWLWAAACVVLVISGGWFVHYQRSVKTAVAEDTPSSSPVEVAPSETHGSATPGDSSMPKAPAPTVVTNGTMGPFKPDPGDFAILKRLKGHTELVYTSVILSDQRRAVSGGNDNTLFVWDVTTGARLQSFPSPVGDIHGMVASKEGSRVLVWSYRSDQVSIFDIDSGTSTALISSPTNTLTNVIWSADEKSAYLLCKNMDGGIYHWNPSKGAVLEKFGEWPRAAFTAFPLPPEVPGGTAQIMVMGSTLKPSPNSTSAANPSLITDKPWAALFSTPDHHFIRDLPEYKNLRNELSLSPDGSTIAGGLGVIYLLDVPELTTRSSIAPPAPQVATQASAWAAGGRMLLIGYNDGLLRLCEADSGTEFGRLDIGMRANEISVSKDDRWLLISCYPLDVKKPKPDDFDVLVVRLPDLNKLGTEHGFLASARRQLEKLDSIDPELAALRTKATPADAIATDDQLRTLLLDLTGKYGAALERSAATGSTKEQYAMRAEAAAIAKGLAVPDASTDSMTSGEHRRLRDIYRQQLAQLETRRQESAAAIRQALGAAVEALAAQRRQNGDQPGVARCDALLASVDGLKPFSMVVSSAFKGTAPSPRPAPTLATSRPSTPSPISLPVAVTPPPTTSNAAPAPKIEFARGVRVDVAISRPSKAAVYDDVTQVITPKIKLTNTTGETYTSYKASFFLIGESAAQRGIYKIMQRHDFDIALPPRETLESEGQTVVTEYDSNASNGVTFGYKYDGWVIQVIDPSNGIAYTKSTSPTLEKMVESIQSLKAGQYYDRRWKPVNNAPN